LLVVPLPLALLHQAGAMLVLTVATLHAANVTARTGYATAGARGAGGFADALRPTGT
jgi:heme A synthase